MSATMRRDEGRFGRFDPGPLTTAALRREADALGPHGLVLVRAVHAKKDAAVLYVAVCVCRWETLTHQSEELARRKFRLHLDAPWSAFGF